MRSAPHRSIRLRSLDRQVQRLSHRIAQLEQMSGRYVRARASLAAGGAVSVALCFLWVSAIVGWSVFGLVVAVFALLARLHVDIKTSLLRHRLWRTIKTTQLARASLEWVNIPAPLEIKIDPAHPFELDLDLVGPRSLHRLIDTALSQEGSNRLRDWLTRPLPELGESRHRQRLIRQLEPLSLFREKLALQGALAAVPASGRWDSSVLIDWLHRSIGPSLGRPLLLSGFLLVATLVFLLLDWFAGFPSLWALFLLPYLALFFARQHAVLTRFHDVLMLEKTLRLYRNLFGFLENFHYYGHEALAELCRPFTEPGSRPSGELARIRRIVAALSVRGYAPLWLALNMIVPWDFYFGWRLDRQRGRIAAHLEQWLEIWFELEALNSLANFAYLNPDYVFPTLSSDPPESGGIVLFTSAMGHPLISESKRVCNDFDRERTGQIAIITGSNMAGKSTFLRTLGVNLCLAFAGGPVCARAFSTSFFRLFTCIQVTDSVTDGTSYFYAEVKRLKALLIELERAHPLPLFFLVDEVFKGTNNRERLIGSRGFVRALTRLNGLGIISTHDLELATLAEELPLVDNFHFQEEISQGEMVFDYRLRAGPSTTTNALRIMRLEGLPI